MSFKTGKNVYRQGEIMKKANVLAALAVTLLISGAAAEETALLSNPKNKMSYVVGVDMARNFKRQGIDVDLDLLVKGLRDGMSGERLIVTEADFRQSLIMIQNEQRARQRVAGRTAEDINKYRGTKFLADNKDKEGVTTLPSGLQYKILKAGEGKKPTAVDTVECSYRGTHLEGTQFASTNAGEPATFKVNEASVPAWKEALPLMPLGSTWRLFIPPQLAYGAAGVGRDVGPNETVIFDLELVGIK